MTERASEQSNRRKDERLVADPIGQSLDTERPVVASTRRQELAIWIGRASITTLRIALGLVFLLFGALKFFSDVSPAEDISVRTVDTMTFGLIEGDVARYLVAAVEVTIGLLLVSGRYLKVGIALLLLAMVGILAPLVLFPEDLFAGRYNAPTLLGQYVIKDVVLLAAGLVVMARLLVESTTGGEKG